MASGEGSSNVGCDECVWDVFDGWSGTERELRERVKEQRDWVRNNTATQEIEEGIIWCRKWTVSGRGTVSGMRGHT